MNHQEVYNHIKEQLAPQLTELQQAVMLYEVERYREEIAGHLQHDVQDWINAVCEVYNTRMEYIHTKSRKRELVMPRQIIMWGLITGIVPNKLSLSAIGLLFSRDHATALHAKRKVYESADTDQEMRETIIKLINRFGWTGGYNPETRSFWMSHSTYAIRSAA
jgi:chromosomal replication initiation ATPase DnaA